jgi:hypothetical protein
MAITVSIVTYKTDLGELERCMASLQSEMVKRVYVVDNSSQTAIEDFCCRYHNVTYLPGENVGYGAGHNRALRRVLKDDTVKYHLVLNSDVYFDPSVLEYLISYMELHDEVAQLQPRVVYPNGELQYTCRLLPTPANLIFRRFLPKALGAKMDRRYTLAFWDHGRPIDIAYHQGSFMLFRTSAFAEVGLFDERFFMYPEDIDITRRMHRRFRTVYLPHVSIVHAHRAASYKNRKMLRIHIVNMIRYFNKWGWLCDKERREWNRQLLNELGYRK